MVLMEWVQWKWFSHQQRMISKRCCHLSIGKHTPGGRSTALTAVDGPCCIMHGGIR